MKHFARHTDKSTLLLIDEFGGGTEPQIGGAIAEALLHRFNEQEGFGVVTTHYQNLKAYAEETPGLVNGAMLYDRHEMRPLFRLSIGRPGSSFAIEIARKIGLPEEVIAEATYAPIRTGGREVLSGDEGRDGALPAAGPAPRLGLPFLLPAARGRGHRGGLGEGRRGDVVAVLHLRHGLLRRRLKIGSPRRLAARVRVRRPVGLQAGAVASGGG